MDLAEIAFACTMYMPPGLNSVASAITNRRQLSSSANLEHADAKKIQKDNPIKIPSHFPTGHTQIETLSTVLTVEAQGALHGPGEL